MIQNSPNPFNLSTVISYQLQNDSHVSLKVFDVMGREVAILLNEIKAKGAYEFNFDASKYELTGGIYFVEMRAGSNVSTIKLVLTQ